MASKGILQFLLSPMANMEKVWNWYFGKFSQNKAEGALADFGFQSVLTEDSKGQI